MLAIAFRRGVAANHDESILLRGAGTAIHRGILKWYPWKPAAITEDVPYALGIIRSAVRIRFLPDVRVLLPCPDGRVRDQIGPSDQD